MKNSRRSFFVQALGFVSLGLVGSLANAEEKRRARPAAGAAAGAAAADAGPLANPILSPKDPLAVPMNYVEKHADLKKPELKIERGGLAFEKQYCNNCSFYKEVGTKEGSKVGSCTIFNAKLVKDQAWCASWNKKA